MNPTMKSSILMATAVVFLAACSGDYAAKEDNAPPSGPIRKRDTDDSIFGEGGISLSRLSSGDLFGNGSEDGGGGSLPVNKYLWQASLDTLSFLPLSSTDPFTGVIATDWGTTAEAPGERFKVTVYILNPNLAASSLKVAVFREARNEDGLWVPSAVSPETALKIEDAILIRARQIRIASLDQEAAG
ncbi:DUF3576 domain-containing protein [Rhodobacteraceae bacterium NNCM2]|nr:DUF3576 domain-containing protein [Coraliihabitans acroporae]